MPPKTENPKTELRQLERELAYSVARADIESCCECAHHSGQHFGWWYDITTASREEGVIDAECVAKATRYLELRKLLKRHPENSNLVHILNEKPTVPPAPQKA